MNARIAVVTGGLGAIGTEICRQLAASGHKVCALDHPSAAPRAEAWRAEHGHPFELADLADFAATVAAFERIAATLGPVDVLVNAAGITRDARLTKMSIEQWRAVLSSNLDSVFHCVKPVFEGMCGRGYGRIVNISSVNGSRGQFGQTNYSAAKAGMHGFTMALAQEGAARGVTVNTVSPGYIETPMTGAMKPEVLEKIRSQIPAGRMGTPNDIARVVAFLCEAGSSYITGANLPVNGGLFISA